MTKTWINFKPKTTNEVWSSNTACVCRSRNSKKEKELKDALENLKFPDLYDSLLSSEELEGLSKVLKQIKAFKKTLDSAVEKGYIIEEPILTVEEQKVVEQKEKESVISDSLLSNLKKEIGHGRQLQKFKHDNEMRGKFNRNLLDLYPVIFLQVPLIRNTLKNLYDNIDLSSFDLKQKEIDAKKPKEIDDREYKKQIDEIEKNPKPKKPKNPKKEKKPEPEPEPESEPESETDEKPSADSIISKVDASADKETCYENLGDASEDDDADCRNLSKSMIRKRMNRNIREYKAFKAKASASKSNESYPIFVANYNTTKAAAKKYKAMLLDFEKNEKQRRDSKCNFKSCMSEDQRFLQTLNDSDDPDPEPKSNIIRDNNGTDIDLNDFFYTKQNSSSLEQSTDEKSLTAGQLKQIEVELKLHLGVSEGWIRPLKIETEADEEEEFDHYTNENIAGNPKNIIIPTDFESMLSMIKTERQNEYPLIIKRLKRHPKLSVLASACDLHPTSVEKFLEKLFIELKTVLKSSKKNS